MFTTNRRKHSYILQKLKNHISFVLFLLPLTLVRVLNNPSETIIKKLTYLLLLPLLLWAEDNRTEPADWGLGMIIRNASIPFGRDGLDTSTSVTSAVPMLYFDSEYLFMDGLEGGLKYDFHKDWRISLVTRLRFSDIPKEFQDRVQLSTYDFGPQLRYKITDSNFIDLEVLTHVRGHSYANLSYRGKFNVGIFEFEPYATLRAKTSNFNSLYYAFDQEKIKGGVDYTGGIDTKLHLVSNLYLLAGAEATLLDSAARHAPLTQKGYQYNAYIGIGAFKELPKNSSNSITNTPYIRGSWGWATHNDLDQILGGSMDKDEEFNQLISIFYGHPLSDSLFGLPIDVYVTPGFVLHLTSPNQPDYRREYDIGFKVFYTIPLPIRIRLGAAEGLSYINETTWIEKTDVLEDGNAKDSNLLNYLDFSAGVNLGDLFFTKSMEKAWFGFNIHHRSGIFSNSAQFGRVSGGSNYPSLYLQLHL